MTRGQKSSPKTETPCKNKGKSNNNNVAVSIYNLESGMHITVDRFSDPKGGGGVWHTVTAHLSAGHQIN